MTSSSSNTRASLPVANLRRDSSAGSSAMPIFFSAARVFDDELVTQENYTLLVRTEDENRDDIRALCAWLVDSCRAGEEN